MLIERIGAGHLRYRVDRKTGVGEVGRLQRRVSHSQECSSTSGARVCPGLTPKAVLEKRVTIQMLAVWLPTTDGRCSTLPAQRFHFIGTSKMTGQPRVAMYPFWEQVYNVGVCFEAWP